MKANFIAQSQLQNSKNLQDKMQHSISGRCKLKKKHKAFLLINGDDDNINDYIKCE